MGSYVVHLHPAMLHSLPNLLCIAKLDPSNGPLPMSFRLLVQKFRSRVRHANMNTIRLQYYQQSRDIIEISKESISRSVAMLSDAVDILTRSFLVQDNYICLIDDAGLTEFGLESALRQYQCTFFHLSANVKSGLLFPKTAEISLLKEPSALRSNFLFASIQNTTSHSSHNYLYSHSKSF